MWISPICAHCQEGAVERWWVNISVLWMHRQASKMVWFLDTVQPVYGTVNWGSSEQKSFVMNVSQTINPDQKVLWYSISLPCLLLKPEEYQTTRFIFVQVNKQLALSRHAASIATRYVCSMPPVCPCRLFQRNAVTDQFNCVLSVSLTQWLIYQRKEKCIWIQ